MTQKALSKLKLWPDNYNEGDIGMIATSIRRFGFNDPPGVWKNNEVRDGNHRVLALRAIKADGPRPDDDKKWPPQGVTVKGDDWHIDWIDLRHLNEQEATAYAVAANRAVALASQDELKLSMLLQNIAAEDERLLAATGYSGDDIDTLIKYATNDNYDFKPLDEFPEYGEDIATDHQCPKCGYQWSGSPS
jgi:ParB-like chromosome segregation protein Spo0J